MSDYETDYSLTNTALGVMISRLARRREFIYTRIDGTNVSDVHLVHVDLYTEQHEICTSYTYPVLPFSVHGIQRHNEGPKIYTFSDVRTIPMSRINIILAVRFCTKVTIYQGSCISPILSFILHDGT